MEKHGWFGFGASTKSGPGPLLCRRSKETRIWFAATDNEHPKTQSFLIRRTGRSEDMPEVARYPALDRFDAVRRLRNHSCSVAFETIDHLNAE